METRSPTLRSPEMEDQDMPRPPLEQRDGLRVLEAATTTISKRMEEVQWVAKNRSEDLRGREVLAFRDAVRALVKLAGELERRYCKDTVVPQADTLKAPKLKDTK